MSPHSGSVASARTAAWLSRAYERHGRAVFAYAFHLAGERGEAERLSVAVFVEAHRVLAAGGSIGRPRVWLLTRVRDRAPILPHDRRGGTLRHLPPAGVREITAVRAELARLEPPGEDALVLRQWCGLRPAEIAAVLGVPTRVVRRALAEWARAARPRGGRTTRRVASAVAAAGIGVAAADLRAGVPKALASTVPGFTAGSTTAAAGLGAVPLAAGALKAGVAVAAAAAAIGAAHTVAPALPTPWSGGDAHRSGSPPTAAKPSGGYHGGGSRRHRHAGGKPGRAGAHPSKPSHPAKPAHPSTPAHPAQPTHPSKPAHPAHPTHPAKPAKPTHPTHPTRPSKPANPGNPSGPGTPSHPGKPAKP
jgi:DNA-directed RNA polymerase specialized sigma24 family protein